MKYIPIMNGELTLQPILTSQARKPARKGRFALFQGSLVNLFTIWAGYILLFFCTFPPLLLAGDQPALPIHNIEAEHIDFNEKTIHMIGAVKVDHEFGVIRCQEATLVLRQEKKEGETLPVDRILLNENVAIEFSEGHTLLSDEGDIDCQTLEGVFLAAPSRVVTYISYSENGPLKTPLKATSKALKGKITKTPQGYELTELRGEGAVHIESIQKESKPTEKTHE